MWIVKIMEKKVSVREKGKTISLINKTTQEKEKGARRRPALHINRDAY